MIRNIKVEDKKYRLEKYFKVSLENVINYFFILLYLFGVVDKDCIC